MVGCEPPAPAAASAAGEFFLPLAERLFGATAPPVTRDRRPLRIHFAVFADVGPKVVHDRLRFAVDKGVHLAGKPRGGLDRLDQRRVVAGSVLADQIGPPAAVNPIDLDTVRRGQRDFVLGPGDLDERLANCVGGQRFQRNADGRQRASRRRPANASRRPDPGRRRHWDPSGRPAGPARPLRPMVRPRRARRARRRRWRSRGRPGRHVAPSASAPPAAWRPAGRRNCPASTVGAGRPHRRHRRRIPA